jgi:hypothetical protein
MKLSSTEFLQEPSPIELNEKMVGGKGELKKRMEKSKN